MRAMIKGLNDESFRNIMSTSLFGSFVMLIAGIIMFLFPDKVNDFIGYIVGGLCFISGIDSLYKYIRRNGARLYSLNIIFTLLLIILGIMIILTPNSITKFTSICFGLFLIIKGFNKISYAIWFKVGNHPSWTLVFTTGLIIAVFGLMLFFDIFTAIDFTKLIGVFIILTNILDILNLVMVKNKSEEITKIFW